MVEKIQKRLQYENKEGVEIEKETTIKIARDLEARDDTKKIRRRVK